MIQDSSWALDPNQWRKDEERRRQLYGQSADVATGCEMDPDFVLAFTHTSQGYVVTVKHARRVADVVIPDRDGLYEVKGTGPAVQFRVLTQEQYERVTALRLIEQARV